MTNRHRNENADGFTGRGKKLTRGRVEVAIPSQYPFGLPRASVLRRIMRTMRRRKSPLAVSPPTFLAVTDFEDELRRMMIPVDSSDPEPRAMFYIHGYCTNFEEGAIRAAQLTHDLKISGPTCFFSWPSRGIVLDYLPDEASLQASEHFITDGLVEFASTCGSGRVDVIAHSMGNLALLRAVERISIRAEAATGIKLGQVILAAPDVDSGLFHNLAKYVTQQAVRATMYVSSADRALHLSAHAHDAARAGYFEPYTIASGVDTVAVPGFDIDLLGHSYFGSAAAVLQDMYEVLRYGTAPAHRQRMTNLQTVDGACWQLR